MPFPKQLVQFLNSLFQPLFRTHGAGVAVFVCEKQATDTAAMEQKQLPNPEAVDAWQTGRGSTGSGFFATKQSDCLPADMPDFIRKVAVQGTGRAAGYTKTTAITGIFIQTEGMLIENPGLVRAGEYTSLTTGMAELCMYTVIG